MRTLSSPHSQRILHRLAASAIVSSAFFALPSAAQDLTVDAAVSAGAASNPYQREGDTPTSLSTTVDLRPMWTIERPLTTLRLEGDVSATFYNKGYGTNERVLLRGAGTHKLSEYTTINSELGYTNSILGSVNEIRVPIGVVLPDTRLPVLINDPVSGGIGGRFQSYQVVGGISTLLSPRDRLMADVSVSANRYKQSQFQDFNYSSNNVGYSRAIDENFDIGVNFAVNLSDYLKTSIGDATIYTPSFTASMALKKGWTLQASVGAALARVEGLTGDNRSSTTLNGSIALCKRDARWNLCINAARQTVPSAFEGVRSQNNISLSAGYRAGPQDSLSLVASYSHSDGPLDDAAVINGFDGSVDFVVASGNYSHQFRSALAAFVSAAYAKTYGDRLNRDANLTASVGISYRFGARR